jgi:hypothetical protein
MKPWQPGLHAAKQVLSEQLLNFVISSIIILNWENTKKEPANMPGGLGRSSYKTLSLLDQPNIPSIPGNIWEKF